MHRPPTRPSTGSRFADPPNPSPQKPHHIDRFYLFPTSGRALRAFRPAFCFQWPVSLPCAPNPANAAVHYTPPLHTSKLTRAGGKKHDPTSRPTRCTRLYTGAPHAPLRSVQVPGNGAAGRDGAVWGGPRCADHPRCVPGTTSYFVVSVRLSFCVAALTQPCCCMRCCLVPTLAYAHTCSTTDIMPVSRVPGHRQPLCARLRGCTPETVRLFPRCASPLQLPFCRSPISPDRRFLWLRSLSRSLCRSRARSLSPIFGDTTWQTPSHRHCRRHGTCIFIFILMARPLLTDFGVATVSP